MQHGLKKGVRKKSRVAVLDINIDRFKRINETMGHAAGDHVLREVARRILKNVRTSDLAGMDDEALWPGQGARANGDGFSVFLTDVRGAEDAALIARRLIDAIAHPVQWGEHELALSASVGIALHPENGADISTLLRSAEIALHNAKKFAAGSYAFFTPSMNAQSVARIALENDLRCALERDELLLFFQARVNVLTGRLTGAEALVRWQHPLRGMMLPAAFIPLAEQSDLIVPLTAWVVRAVCRQLYLWRGAGLTLVPLSINLSARSFRDDGLCDLIAASLSQYDLEPALLEIEITESMLMQDVDRAVVLLQRLRAMGVHLAMDDFGTGYSALAYLKRFPLHVLKVDRAFVADVLADKHDQAIAAAIVTLGRTIGVAVVAEGIERVEQANYFTSQGCHLMQGFAFAQPVSAVEFAGVLRDGLTMPAGLCA